MPENTTTIPPAPPNDPAQAKERAIRLALRETFEDALDSGAALVSISQWAPGATDNAPGVITTTVTAFGGFPREDFPKALRQTQEQLGAIRRKELEEQNEKLKAAITIKAREEPNGPPDRQPESGQ